jgi:hypothetical protein
MYALIKLAIVVSFMLLSSQWARSQEKDLPTSDKKVMVAARIHPGKMTKSKLSPDLLIAARTNSNFLGYIGRDVVVLGVPAKAVKVGQGPNPKVEFNEPVKEILELKLAPKEFTKITTLIIGHHPGKFVSPEVFDQFGKVVRSDEASNYLVVASKHPFEGFPGKELLKLEGHSAITYIEPNYEVHLPPTVPSEKKVEPEPKKKESDVDLRSTHSLFHSDYWQKAVGLDLSKQWGLEHIRAKVAWKRVTSSEAILGVLDTGIDFQHPDLRDNMWSGPNKECGVSTVPNAKDPGDEHGHGTHCAGIIGAANRPGKGPIGVTWKVKLMALKCLNKDGVGLSDQVVKCIDFALDHKKRENKPMVLNCSWVTEKQSRVVADAIGKAHQAGVLIVAAAGNNGKDNDQVTLYPAGYDSSNIIVVLATDDRDERLQKSNFGKNTVHIGAPGELIYSSKPDGRHGYLTGSSQATAFVTGAVALTWGHPNHRAWQWTKVKDALLNNARNAKQLKSACSTAAVLDISFLKA